MFLVDAIATLACLTAVAANATTVPFVGCKPSGLMDGGITASGNPVEVNFPPSIASKVAVYVGDHFSVLAPRGWTCTYNTTGQQAEIEVFPRNEDKQVASPKISEQYFDVGTPSAVMHTVGIGAQLFPEIIAPSDLASESSFLGFSSVQQFINSGKIIKVNSTDRLKYVSNILVEYTTPPQTKGIGSQLLGPWSDGELPGTTMPSAFVSSGFVSLHLISKFSHPIDNLKGISIFGMRLPHNLNNLSKYILKFGEDTSE